MGKPFGKITRADLEQFFASGKLAPNTMATTQIIVKCYYRRRHPQSFPKVAAWITPRRTNKDRRPQDLFTPEEVKAIIDASPSERYKAFWDALYESGARITEFLQLRTKDVRFEQGYAVITLPEGAASKTGRRTIPIFFSAPYLQRYLENNYPRPLMLRSGNPRMPQASRFNMPAPSLP